MTAKKRRPLDTAALAAAAIEQPDPVRLATTTPTAAPPKGAGAGAGRSGKVAIQGYFPEETRRRLRMLAAQTDRTIEDLLGEAIDALLAKHSA